MEYGEVITRAFSIAWRFKYLWVLALLGGADVGAVGGFNLNLNYLGLTGPGGSTGPAPAFDTRPVQQLATFIGDNLGLIVAVGVLLLLLITLVWLPLSSVAIGALVRAAAEHDAERPFHFGLAWRAGVWRFWPILGLRLLAFLWALFVLAVLGLLIALGIGFFASNNPGAGFAVVAAGILVVLLLTAASIPIGIALILGIRSIVLEQAGVFGGLARGFRLLGRRLGRVLLVWLIQVALTLAAGMGMTVVSLLLAIPMGLMAGAVFAIGGPLAGLVVAVPLGVLFLAVTILIAVVTGSYFSTYWTLAFRRLEIDAPPRPAYYPAYPGHQAPPAGG